MKKDILRLINHGHMSLPIPDPIQYGINPELLIIWSKVSYLASAKQKEIVKSLLTFKSLSPKQEDMFSDIIFQCANKSDIKIAF